MSARKVKIDRWQKDPERREEYRQERFDLLRDHLTSRHIMVIEMWVNRDGDKHDLIVITPGDGISPRNITYDVASVLDWDLYERDGRYVIRFGGGNVSPADSLRQALSIALFGTSHSIGLA